MPLRSPAATARQQVRGAVLIPLLFAGFLTGLAPAVAADFMDAAGRRVALPEPIERVMPASPTAEVLLFVLAPEKMAGLSQPARRGAGVQHRVPVLSWRPGMGPASMAETARRLHPDLIVDAGLVTPERAAFADQVQQQTGIPYILVDDSFPRIPAVLRGIGAVLDVTERSRHLARYAEDAINVFRGRLLIVPSQSRPHVYYGRRADGLETPLPGSPEGESIDQAGAINVAGSLGRGHLVDITPAQLFEWDPEIIIAERRSFYDALRRNRAWRGLAAVRKKRVYLAPASPFGWIDDPPGVNRLIGAYWLSALLYPESPQEGMQEVAQQDLPTNVCEFYDKFYGIKLTNGQIEAMVRSAGVPLAPTPHPASELLPGLGAAPSSPPPSTTPTAPAAAPPSTEPLSPLMPSEPSATTTPAPSTSQTLPNVPVEPAPSTAAATCALPGANSPLTLQLPSNAPATPPPGRRGPMQGLGGPGAAPR